MLDQNTDRMWFVIGAVIVGAAIIFIANGTIPEIFASVTDSFKENATKATDVIESMSIGYGLEHFGVIGEDIRLLQTYDPVTSLRAHHGAELEKEERVTFPESVIGEGTHYETSGGTARMKVYRNIRLNSEHTRGDVYVYDVEVKNLNDEPLRVYNHFGHGENVAPGDFAVVRLIGDVDPHRTKHMQIRLEALSPEGSVDAIVGRLTLGVIEKEEGE